MNVSFKPYARPDGRFAIEIVKDDVGSVGFLHWIESETGRICRCSNGNLCKSFFSVEETDQLCTALKEMYEKGEIK